MNPITDIWRQLVARRLWPVAILLVGALAAVPVLLAKEPGAPVAPPAAPATAPDDGGVLAEEPIVALADEAAGASSKRRPLGKRHNIFKSTKKPVKAKSADDAPEATVPKDETTSGGETPTGGALPAPTTPVAPVPMPEPEQTEPEKKYEAGELTVRFDGKRRSVKELDPLPSAEEPTLIYTGTIKDGKVAEFLVDASVTAIGDGECHPSPDACESLRLREGDIEFIDVKDETGTVVKQYEIELVEIHKGKKSASRAKSARTVKAVSALRGGAAKASRSELRSVAALVDARLP